MPAAEALAVLDGVLRPGDRTHEDLIELDGHQHHSSEADWVRDVRRSTGFTADGWLVLRSVWDDIRGRPAGARAAMRRARDRRDAEFGR